jgi:hypothetical protein
VHRRQITNSGIAEVPLPLTAPVSACCLCFSEEPAA